MHGNGPDSGLFPEFNTYTLILITRKTTHALEWTGLDDGVVGLVLVGSTVSCDLIWESFPICPVWLVVPLGIVQNPIYIVVNGIIWSRNM